VNATAEIRALWEAGWPLIHLETVEEERALGVAREVAAARGARLSAWTATGGLSGHPELAGPGDMLSAVAGFEAPTLVVLHDFHRWLDDPRVVRRLRDVARPAALAGHLLLLVAPPFEAPAELSADLVRVALPLPGAAELEAVLAEVESARGRGAAPERREALAAAARGLTEEEARRAFYRALAEEERGADGIAGVAALKRRRLRDAAIEVIEEAPGLGNVGGLEGLKGWLAERRGAFAASARAFGLPAPRGVLLLGVQGCGKSLACKAIASSLGLPLLRLDLAALFGGAVEASAALKRAVRAAEAIAPCALWIDELEKGLAGADAAREGASPEGARLLGSFAVWLQEKAAPVLVLATANEVAALPPELLRRGRFDEVFFVDLPDERAREEILGIHLRTRGRDPARYAVAALARATEHFSGAELEAVVVSALYRAFAAGRDLSDEDLKRAAGDAVPLYRTYEERVKALRAWAKDRARPAGRRAQVLDLLGGR
jgi:hypothetical protein